MSLLLSMSRHLAGEHLPVCPSVTPAWRSLWFTGICVTGPASCPRSTTIPLLTFTNFFFYI